MFKNFNLTFPQAVSEYICKEYEHATNILEYGAGGSTLFAASKGKTVISTESSPTWLIELMGSYKEKKLPGDIIPIYCDIGKTKQWGVPKNEKNWKNWPNYSKAPWLYCHENNINPDLILIDGRFRVSCFLASCINTTLPVKILFDDFEERPQYHIVKNILEPSKIVNNRMAVFDVKPGMVDTKLLLDNLTCFYNPA